MNKESSLNWFQISSSDPSSPSTPTTRPTRQDLYLPVRRPSVLESVLNMTKEISIGVKPVSVSSASPTNYPGDDVSTDSRNDKRTVSYIR